MARRASPDRVIDAVPPQWQRLGPPPLKSAGAPEVWLIDARSAGLDEHGLRALAREHGAAGGAPYRSRSYRYPYALVACHTEAVGVDIERIEPYDEAFLASISTPDEVSLLVSGADLDGGACSLWSGKEALAKALGDALRYDPRLLGSPMFWPAGRSGPWRARRLPAPAGHVAWLCWRRTAGR